jgi:peptide/nickel transport system ATP-binding protein
LLIDVPDGCRFAPRCPFAIARCRTETPVPMEVDPLHMVACWRAADAPALRLAAANPQTWAA